MRYVIPHALNCTHCTLQWYWSTGNTCVYDAGYFSYFDKMRESHWADTTDWCNFCNPGATCAGTCCGAASDKYAEEFWNCADIAVRASGAPAPTPGPTPAPTAAPTYMPSPAVAPTPAVVSPSTAAPTPSTPTGPCAPLWGQCGGANHLGPFCCQVGSVCNRQNEWYSQCIESVSTPAPGPMPAPTPAPTSYMPTSPPTPSPPTPVMPPTSPATCASLCGLTADTSCSVHADQGICETSYMTKGQVAIPCSWTSCGCIADGQNLMDCPDLASLCHPSVCTRTCGGQNLTAQFINWTLPAASSDSWCHYYDNSMAMCETSYVGGNPTALTVPCTWSVASSCVANHVMAEDCTQHYCQ